MIHLLTGEYAPTPGGVADYTALVARELVSLGEAVHVWTPGGAGVTEEDGVVVHRIGHRFSPTALAQLDRELSRHSAPRRIIVQWTPHSYGYNSLNLGFTAWVWKRAYLDHDRIELMVHEPFLTFEPGRAKQNAAALIHRTMAVALLDAAAKVWIAIPAWEQRLRPWLLRRQPEFQWLPVPANIDAAPDPAAVRGARHSMAPANQSLVGHFGTFRRDVAELLEPALIEVLEASPSSILLAGRNSQAFRQQLLSGYPAFRERIFATGDQPASTIAEHLAACDLLLQPYPDGVSTRRGTAMAALALGLPMVTNLGYLSEPLWRGGAVELAESRLPKAFVFSTLRLLNDRAGRVRLSTRARELYQQRFHVRHTAAALVGTSASLQEAHRCGSDWAA